MTDNRHTVPNTKINQPRRQPDSRILSDTPSGGKVEKSKYDRDFPGRGQSPLSSDDR